VVEKAIDALATPISGNSGAAELYRRDHQLRSRHPRHDHYGEKTPPNTVWMAFSWIRRLTFDAVEVSAPTNLALGSDILDTPAAEMAALNPAILKGVVPEGYTLRVPKGSGNQLLAALAAHSRGTPRFLARASCRRGETLAGYRQMLRRLARQHRRRQPPVVGPSRGGRPAADSRGPARGGSRPADHRRADHRRTDYRPADSTRRRTPVPALRPRRLWRRSAPLRPSRCIRARRSSPGRPPDNPPSNFRESHFSLLPHHEKRVFYG